MIPPKYVSPSRLARFFYLECERFLRFSSTPRESRRREGVPATSHAARPVHQAVLEGGYEWEERALTTYLAGRARIAEPTTPGARVRERAHSVDETHSLLSEIRPGEAIYQATLRVPAAFYARYGFDTSVVAFSDCRPDLIEATELESGVGLRVTDLKASHGLKLSHRIQAALYTLILRDVLEGLPAPGRSADLDPAIWLVDQPAAEVFDIRAILPPLEQFLVDGLGPLLERPAAEAPWHVRPRCEQCDYFDHCQAEMRATNDVSRVAYLSSHAKQRLAGFSPPVRTVDDLAALLEDPDRRGLIQSIGSLRGRADRLAAEVRALRSGDIVAIGGNSLAMPRGEHVRLILTVQTEPVTGYVYAWAITAQGLRGLLEPNPLTASAVALSRDPREIARIERELVQTLYRILAAVDAFNAARTEDWSAQKTLQAYAFDTYEVALLTGVLTRALRVPEIAEQSLRVFFHFHRPELMEAAEHPAAEAAIPVVVLTSVIQRLLALPAETMYRFVDVARLLPSERGFAYRPFGYFDYELSNQLRPDAVFALWNAGEERRAKQIEDVLRARVWATNGLVDGVRSEIERLQPGALFAWPPRFRLPERLGFRDRLLSRLAFVAQYEALLRYLDIRGARMAPLTERLRSQTTIELVAESTTRFRIIHGGDEIDIEEDGFPDRILTPATPDGERAALLFPDYHYRSRPWAPKKLALAVASVRTVERDPADRPTHVTLGLNASSAFGAVEPGQRYRLDRRFTDHNSDHAISELRDVDAEPASLFRQLLRDPVGLAGTPAFPTAIRKAALELGRHHGMTPSQLATFEMVVRGRVALAWGPPGTGKTHFVALAMLCLLEAHRRFDRPYSVLVTGFTHAAIDNCLRKVGELHAAKHVVAESPAIAKLGRTQLEGMEAVSVIPPNAAGAWLDGNGRAVVGGTVWAIRKDVPPWRVNLAVIDEGSQLRVHEAAIAIRRVRANGSVLIAGDHLQLPPIIQGLYPEPVDGEPLLHRSIFEAIRAQDATGVLTGTLLENFRMNTTLCRYPAEHLYDERYTSATPAIGTRRLRLGGRGRGDLADLVIDPEFPLVVGVTDGVSATAENLPEAAIVADVAVRLRERLLQGTKPFSDDARFWRDGVFIVSPHHVQIRAIRRALRQRRAWTHRPFVDTVDKMQGQECDVVLTSYGVADVEYAMTESEFIYSLNRLNVSTTRGRSKTAVFLSRALLEPPIQAFENDAAADGIAFMQGLVQFAARCGEEVEVGLPEDRTLRLYRVR